MKTLKTLLLVMSLAVFATLARAQQPRLYAAIDYMHIPEDRSEQDYIALEKLWQRLHQKATDAGICRGWYLERVENGGRNDFVTIRVYDSLDKLVNPWPDSLTKDLFTTNEMAQIRQTEQVRQLAHSELWEIEAAAVKKIQDGGEHFALITFMKPKPGKEQEYYKAEKEIFRKVHQARVDAGVMNGWYFLSRMYPSGYDSPFDYITVNIYADKAAAEKPWDMKLLEKALDKDELAKSNTFLDMRTAVRNEIWHSVLRAVPSKN
jgi:hypothetical protein